MGLHGSLASEHAVSRECCLKYHGSGMRTLHAFIETCDLIMRNRLNILPSFSSIHQINIFLDCILFRYLI